MFKVELEIVVNGIKRYMNFTIQKKFVDEKQKLIKRILKKIKMNFFHINDKNKYKKKKLKMPLYFNLVKDNDNNTPIDLDKDFEKYHKIVIDKKAKKIVVTLSELGQENFEEPPGFPKPNKNNPNYEKYMKYFDYYYRKYYPELYILEKNK